MRRMVILISSRVGVYQFSGVHYLEFDNVLYLDIPYLQLLYVYFLYLLSFLSLLWRDDCFRFITAT